MNAGTGGMRGTPAPAFSPAWCRTADCRPPTVVRSSRHRAGYRASPASSPAVVHPYGPLPAIMPVQARSMELSRNNWFARARLTRSVFPPHVVSTRNRSEEHTSELQSQSKLVCRLLLEKKKRGGARAEGKVGSAGE